METTGTGGSNLRHCSSGSHGGILDIDLHGIYGRAIAADRLPSDWMESVRPAGFHAADGRVGRRGAFPVLFQVDTPLGANTILLHNAELALTRLQYRLRQMVNTNNLLKLFIVLLCSQFTMKFKLVGYSHWKQEIKP